jgi:hypothetical protein
VFELDNSSLVGYKEGMKKTGPISPDEVASQKIDSIPDGVFEVFNAVIVENWNSRTQSAKFLQDDVVDRLVNKLDVTREEIFSNKWLDVEDAYREQGWEVTFDKPGYNETYLASFLFQRMSKHR